MTWGLWGHTAGQDVPDPVCAECGEPVEENGDYGWAHTDGSDDGHYIEPDHSGSNYADAEIGQDEARKQVEDYNHPDARRQRNIDFFFDNTNPLNGFDPDDDPLDPRRITSHTAARTAAAPDMHHWDLDWSQAEQKSIPTAGLQWRQYPDYGKPTGRFNFKKMPPVKVLIHEGEPWIMDGHHRVDWAQQRGYREVPALVMEHPSHTAHRTAMPTLYRGLQHEFDPDRPATPIGAPNGYSHWTDSPDIARQWAGPEGHVYSYDLPDEAMGSKWLNENADGKTPLYFDNGPLIGRPGAPKLKGREYLVYNDHDDYDPTQIKPCKKAKHMTAAVTVYTKPSCVQCDMTKKLLERLGVEHSTVDVTADPDAHAYVTGLGYQQAPVVVIGDGEEHWAGFKPDRIKGLVT